MICPECLCSPYLVHIYFCSLNTWNTATQISTPRESSFRLNTSIIFSHPSGQHVLGVGVSLVVDLPDLDLTALYFSPLGYGVQPSQCPLPLA